MQKQKFNLDNILRKDNYFSTTNPRYLHKLVGNGWIINIVKLENDKCQIHASHMTQVKPTLNNPFSIPRGQADHRALGRKLRGIIPSRNYVRLFEAHEVPNHFVVAMADALTKRLQ